MLYKYFKRLSDIFISLFALIILSPVLIVVTFLLYIVNQGKPFYFQKRPGKSERIFSIIKFKSMNDATDKDGVLLPGKERITKVGGIVRRTSLDEIPQFINVLMGDMSLVGPRPLHVHYLPLYNSRQKRRHDVRPGITGWAQVNGRNSISWTEKFEYDVWYVENISFLLDLKIIFLTFKKLIVAKDVNSSADQTMYPFKGNIE